MIPNHPLSSPKPARRVTLLDVARKAGVSRATASLVVRNSPLIAAYTREKVMAAMKDLGYVYHRAAASLRSQQTGVIGLIITDITNPFFAQLTVSCETRLEEAGYSVLLGNTSDTVSKQDRILAMMHEFSVDGILICPANDTDLSLIERLDQWQLPYVLVARYLFEREINYVGADNLLGAQLATEHLVQSGHRRIGFIGGSPRSSARSDRYQGYCNVLQRYQIAIDPGLSVTSPVTREGGRAALLELLSLSDPPTAALCYNDIVAFGVMLGLQAAGKTAGKDFDVIGFDDIEEAALWTPSLSSVAMSPNEIGLRATNLLLSLIENPDNSPQRIVLPPKLVIRQSCCRT